MARATSFNWQLHLGPTPADWIYPSSIGEFGEGEEGRIDVADGDRKYKIRDQIFNIDEIEIVILLRDNDRREYDLLMEWATDSGSTSSRDVWIVAKGAGQDVGTGNGAGRVETMKFLLQNCQCAMGKKSAFDRQGKTFDTRKFTLIPEYVIEETASRAVY